MKNKANYLIMAFFVLSLLCNGLLLYYINETEKPKPSIMKFGSGESDMVIYCSGKSGFKITLETAKMFDRQPCKKCVI